MQIYYNTDSRVQIRFNFIDEDDSQGDKDTLSFVQNKIKYSFISTADVVEKPDSDFIFTAKKLLVPLEIIKRLPRRALITNHFNALKRKLDVGNVSTSTEKVLNILNTKRSADEIKINCPFHNDKHPSLSLNVKKNIFYCFGCNKSGNSVELLNKLQSKANEGRV
jgi:hypothetical protein